METQSKTYLIFGWTLVVIVIFFLLFPLSSYQSGVPLYTEGFCGASFLSDGTNLGEIITEWLIIIFTAAAVFMLVAYYYVDKKISISGDLNSTFQGVTGYNPLG